MTGLRRNVLNSRRTSGPEAPGVQDITEEGHPLARDAPYELTPVILFQPGINGLRTLLETWLIAWPPRIAFTASWRLFLSPLQRRQSWQRAG